MTKQLQHFLVAESRSFYRTFYGDETEKKLSTHAVPLAEYKGLKNLIVHEGIIAGALVETSFNERALMLNRPICVYSASDNEGNGSNEREDYAYLLFSEEARV